MSNIISLSQAIAEAHAYQNEIKFQGLTISSTISKADYDCLLSQNGCVSVRTYFAIDAYNNLTIVVIGVDEEGSDITNGIILGNATLCPFQCQSSPLKI